MVITHEDASHFLLSILSITEGPTNEIMRKSGIPSRDSTLEQFFFYRVSGNAKININQNNTSVIKERLQETQFFSIFLHPAKQKLSQHGGNLWLSVLPIFLLFFQPRYCSQSKEKMKNCKDNMHSHLFWPYIKELLDKTCYKLF